MKKKMKSKKWITALFAIPAATIFPLTSCGMTKSWDWLTSTKNNTQINYCLLIGQNDHTDSQMRTHGTRKALNTLDQVAAAKDGYNANIANPVQGNIRLYKDGDRSSGVYQDFVVNEIEHMEQKSIGGASWDPITANATTSTWIAKHGNNITFFVSNNDSMAEGAMWASNWIKGMPIFGYDANSTTLQWINHGGITGTVDQSPSSQAAAAMMILRKMFDEKTNLWSQEAYNPEAMGSKFGTKDYDPTKDVSSTVGKGNGFDSDYVTNDNKNFGKVNDKDDKSYFTERDRGSTGTKKLFDCNELLSKSTAITNLAKNTPTGYSDPDFADISQFMIKGSKEAKQPRNMFDDFTSIQSPKDIKTFNICHTYSNRSEAFLIATMKPYYDEYAKRLGINPDVIQGDGTDEKLVLDQIKARQDVYRGGYLICLAKTTSGLQYVLDLAKRTFKYENDMIGYKKTTYLASKIPGYEKWDFNDDPNWKGWTNFEERLDTPIIFWIREPFTPGGKIDDSILKANNYFKYAYYIGSDSKNAGEVQGKLIKQAITRWYSDSIKE